MSWDDSDDDDWETNDDELDKKLGLTKNNKPAFDDEEDLAVIEREAAAKAREAELKKKGEKLAARKREEAEKAEELELARRTMELEQEEIANMTPDQLREFKRLQIEKADHALTDDLFGGVDDSKGKGASVTAGACGALTLTDLPQHLKHARKVASVMRVRFYADFGLV